MTSPDPTAQLKPVCPNCGATRDSGESFCEVCGLDFATGKLPAPPQPPAPASAAVGPPEWVITVGVDEDYFRTVQPDDGSLSLPTGQVEQEIPVRGDEVLIGRTSVSANVHPDVDLGRDPGVSRRHALLKRKGDEWVVVDQGSTNGTRVGGEVIAAGEERSVAPGTAVNVGAWTRLTLKRAESPE